MTPIEEFLADHPEYRPDVATVDFGSGPDDALTLDGTIAFIDWMVRTKGVSRHLAGRVKESLRRAFPGEEVRP